MDKFTKRKRRATKPRAKIKRLGAIRLTIHRTPRHMYAQVINPEGKVLACASTLEKLIRESHSNGGNVQAAKEVGKRVAERAKEAGVTAVAFDRSGYKYHGRIKMLADAAREAGMEF